MKCQLWDLQLLVIVELSDSCSSVFSKGQGVIISHLRRKSQIVQGKESFLSEMLIYTRVIQQKRGKTKCGTPEIKASSNIVSSWLEPRCDCGDLLPTHPPTARVSGGGEFLLSLPKESILVWFSHVQQHLDALEVSCCFLFQALPCGKDVLYTCRHHKGGEGWIPRALLCRHITSAISIKGESLPDGQAWGLFLVACSFIKTHKNTCCPSSPSGVQVCPL